MLFSRRLGGFLVYNFLVYIHTSAILHPRCRILFYTKVLY